MIGGKRTEAGRERRAAEVGELVGMQFYPQAERAGCGEEAGGLVGAEGDSLAETVDGVGQAFATTSAGSISAMTRDDIRVLVAVRFRRQGMRRRDRWS